LAVNAESNAIMMQSTGTCNYVDITPSTYADKNYFLVLSPLRMHSKRSSNFMKCTAFTFSPAVIWYYFLNAINKYLYRPIYVVMGRVA